MTELLARFPRQEDIKVGDFSLLFFIKRLTNVESFKTHVFRYCFAYCCFLKVSCILWESVTPFSVLPSATKCKKVSISCQLYVGLRTFSQAARAWLIKKKLQLVKLTSREKVSNLNIHFSDDISLFAASRFTNCGIKLRYQTAYISKTSSYQKSAITLWVKHAHLVAWQRSNTGLSVKFIASNKLINQSLHSQVLDRAHKIHRSWNGMPTLSGVLLTRVETNFDHITIHWLR